MAKDDVIRLENPQAERAILGGVLLHSDTIYQCAALKPEDFNDRSHRIIFERMQDLAEAGIAVDIVTLSVALTNSRQLEMVGGDAYISSLIDGVPDTPHLDSYVAAVKDVSRRRQLVAIARGSVAQCEDMSETTQDCVSLTLDRLLAMAGEHGNGAKHIKEFAADVFMRVQKEHQTPLSDRPIGLPTGIATLDFRTTGIRSGEYWLIASFTGEGKTVLLTQIMMQQLRYDIPVLWWTFEMTRDQVIKRMLPGLTNGQIKMRMLRDPRHMTASQFELFRASMEAVEQWPLWIDDSASIDVGHLYAHSLAMIKQHKIQLIGVDYLQLIKAKGDKEYERITNVSSVLRDLAKVSGVPVLAVSQMARPENREKRMPRIFDLKGSGNIEQDAHVILMPYRPQDKESKYTGEDKIILGKQREGATGQLNVRFDSLTMAFEQRGKQESDDQEILY